MFYALFSRSLCIIALLVLSISVFAQDRKGAQETINQLCSDDMAGRGYINNGDAKAAAFIAEKMINAGLKGFTSDLYYPFALDVNTIKTAEMSINGKTMSPGIDFLVAPNAHSVQGTFKVFYLSPKLLASTKAPQKVKKAIKKGFIPVVSQFDPKNEKMANNYKKIVASNTGNTIILLKSSLTWSVSQTQSKGTEIWLVDSVFDRFDSDISLNIEADFVTNYKSQNVIGYVPGTVYSDSFIVLCGHYDHLGKMGNATFYGANDNASGVSMLLDMASYFVQNPQKYSIAFIAFGAEEAGLVGSQRYVKNPLIPLTKTKFLFNMDLMGSGDKGATIVNGAVFKNHFDSLVSINKRNNYLPTVNPRGKAANSDHYFFTEAGVPSFFIYLMGEYTHYHNPQDNPQNLTLGPYYDKSFQLIRDFIIYLN